MIDIELLSRKIIVFLHIPKTGGSSFWHSLSFHINSSGPHEFGVRDAHHDSLVNFDGDANKSYQSLVRIINEFRELNLKKLFVHYHQCRGDLIALLPNALYLIMLRPPLDRMYSGFRHWRSDFNNADPMDFFLHDASKGINYYLTGISDYSLNPVEEPPIFFRRWVRSNCYFFSLNDYINLNSNLTSFYKSIPLDIDQVYWDPNTVTDRKYSEELDILLVNNSVFAKAWDQRCLAEMTWHECLNLPV
jgi:hypothetical protein